MIELREYLTDAGTSPFADWFNGLDPQAAVKVTTALERMAQGNLSNEKRLRGGILEYHISFGPGYRIYYGKEGNRIIILLGGGTKQGQNSDIGIARRFWNDYRQRNRRERQEG